MTDPAKGGTFFSSNKGESRIEEFAGGRYPRPKTGFISTEMWSSSTASEQCCCEQVLFAGRVQDNSRKGYAGL